MGKKHRHSALKEIFMKITQEQLDKLAAGDLTLEQINQDIEAEVSKSYNAGVEKTKSEIDESGLTAKNEELEKKLQELSGNKTMTEQQIAEALKEIEEIKNSNTEQRNEFKKSEWIKAVGNKMTQEQIDNILAFTPIDKLDEINVDLYARTDVDDFGKNTSNDPSDPKTTLSKEDLLKMAAGSKRL